MSTLAVAIAALLIPASAWASFTHALVLRETCRACHGEVNTHGRLSCLPCHVSNASVIKRQALMVCVSCHTQERRNATPDCRHCHGTSSNPHAVTRSGGAYPHEPP